MQLLQNIGVILNLQFHIQLYILWYYSIIYIYIINKVYVQSEDRIGISFDGKIEF